MTHEHHTRRDQGHLQTLQTLPAPKEGDLECFVIDSTSWDEMWFVDDMTEECICCEDDCKVDWSALYEAHPDLDDIYVCDCGQLDCNKRGKKHETHHTLRTVAVCYPVNFYYTMDFSQGYVCVPYDQLAVFLDGYIPPLLRSQSTREGHLYAIAMNPDLSLHRIKFGFTKKIEQRLASYKTGCPRLMLMGLWDADEREEEWLFSFLDSAQTNHANRHGTSEEFHLYDPFKTLTLIQEALVSHRASVVMY